MFSKAFIFALLPLVAVNASPNSFQERSPEGLIPELWHNITSQVGVAVAQASVAFHAGMANVQATSLYNEATKELGTSTSQLHATIATISGSPVVEIISASGPTITLATGSGMKTVFAGHTFTVATPTTTTSVSTPSGSRPATTSTTSPLSTGTAPTAGPAAPTPNPSTKSSSAAQVLDAVAISQPGLIAFFCVVGSVLTGALVAL